VQKAFYKGKFVCSASSFLMFAHLTTSVCARTRTTYRGKVDCDLSNRLLIYLV